MYFGFPLSVDNLLLVDSPGVSSSVPSPRNSLRPFSPDQKFGKTATPLVNHAPRRWQLSGTGPSAIDRED